MAETETAPEPLEPWSTGVTAVLGPFVTYALARLETGDLDECRRAAKVSPATAEEFERTLDQISADEDDDADQQAGAA